MITSREELLAIDISGYDGIATFPGGSIDWEKKRKKVLFLQTAVKLEVPFDLAVAKTIAFFGPTLGPAPIPSELHPFEVPSFDLPPFDFARQSLAEWKRTTNAAWKEHLELFCDRINKQMEGWKASGELRSRLSNRTASGIRGSKKADIADEKEAYQWAVFRYFGEKPWFEIAKLFPSRIEKSMNPIEARAQMQTRGDQIRKRVNEILSDLGLPTIIAAPAPEEGVATVEPASEQAVTAQYETAILESAVPTNTSVTPQTPDVALAETPAKNKATRAK